MGVWDWIVGSVEAGGKALAIWVPVVIVGYILYWFFSGKDPD